MMTKPVAHGKPALTSTLRLFPACGSSMALTAGTRRPLPLHAAASGVMEVLEFNGENIRRPRAVAPEAPGELKLYGYGLAIL